MYDIKQRYIENKALGIFLDTSYTSISLYVKSADDKYIKDTEETRSYFKKQLTPD